MTYKNITNGVELEMRCIDLYTYYLKMLPIGFFILLLFCKK